MFVFRNYTIENLFDESTVFSGYGDISEIPDADAYIWFYTVPIGFDEKLKLNEIQGIEEKLELVCTQIPTSKSLYIFELADIFSVNICQTDRKLSDAINKFNNSIYELGCKYSNIKVIDINSFLHLFNPNEWINWKYYFISQMVISPAIASKFKIWWKDRLKSFTEPRKKCLVLDLDNTLWSGVLGEDGISGVKMSGDYPGNAFQYFQEALLSLSKSGVILTLCSKNNEDDVKELWEKNPFVKIRPEHIAAYRINWNNKADNIRELAKELNIGMDSMVFVDDNPTERELVRQQLPMVEVPEFPKRSYELMEFYKHLVNEYFQIYQLTTEDLSKTEQYKMNALRASEAAKFTDLTDYIKSLNIHIDIIKADEFNIPRIAQMTQKTNQFNLTTRRYSESDINNFILNGDLVYCISVKDKFGDNGITGAIIINRKGDIAEIDTFLLSCRILGKNIEEAFIISMLEILFEKGISTVCASYIPTLKNSQVENFYERVGFALISKEDNGKKYKITNIPKLEVSKLYTITIK